MDLEITRKQQKFINATATEVLFGGAAGGGKSYGQIVDALLFALKYPGSKQLILRRTFSELDKSIIRTSLMLYPREIYRYNSSSHTGVFTNGSYIDFGYCANENDVNQYQSAEYDVIRFDELTHFTEFQYIYLISRIRGSNGYPKQIKCSTNPGSVGHQWVKARFVDPAPPNTEFVGAGNLTKIFIPSLLNDNAFLMANDPTYRARLEALPERERKALLYGDWNIFDGQYFPEFSRELHVSKPFPIPKEWRRYRAFDYGLDRLACYWFAIDSARTVYVYKELCESNLPISTACERIIAMNDNDEIYTTLAPPDMWSRSQETGRSKASIFIENGVHIVKSSNDREAGWLAIKELLKTDANGISKLVIFDNCTELIKCLPALQVDPKRPTDCSTEPHDITHAPDALRYFAVYWSRPAEPEKPKSVKVRRDIYEDYMSATPSEKLQMEKLYGGKLICNEY